MNAPSLTLLELLLQKREFKFHNSTLLKKEVIFNEYLLHHQEPKRMKWSLILLFLYKDGLLLPKHGILTGLPPQKENISPFIVPLQALWPYLLATSMDPSNLFSPHPSGTIYVL